MLKLGIESIRNDKEWKEKDIECPHYDYQKIKEDTLKNPRWVHFGAGNILRAFIAILQQELLNEG
ncbi:MAG TPA: mannitol dehydrogenase family protein, partial [Halanaerobiales bacterium]|nr:mannitol dehydrogenase family protein [Halanaerobiales bacterium]